LEIKVKLATKVEKGDTLANVLRRKIADKILLNQIEPGERLDEQSLAQEYGVSRTPIREALIQLSASGLVTSRRHVGTVVQLIDQERVGSLCEASIQLESLCAGLAASRMTAIEVGRLKSIHTECEARHKAGDTDGYALENRRFHSSVIQGTHNPDLGDVVELCRLRIAPYQRLPFTLASRREASQREHGALIEALERRDSEAATLAMTRHLSAAAVAIDEQLRLVMQHKEVDSH